MFKMENLGYQDAATTLIKAAKQCMEIWQRLVHITGGKLELDKSSFALMAWKLAAGGEKLYTIKDAPGSVNLRSEK